MNKEFAHIILISEEWESYHRKGFTGTFIERFKGWSDSFLINQPVSLTVHLFLSFRDKFLGLLTGKFKNKEVEPGLIMFTPFILFHMKLWNRFKLLRKIDVYILSSQINKFIGNLNYKNIFLWVYLPLHLHIVKKINYRFLVYDFYDNHIYSLDGKLLEKENIQNDELITKSDIVICTAQTMYENAIRKNKNTIYLTNANNAVSQNSDNFKNSLINNLPDFKEPVIGYIGNIRDWIDFELIEMILKEIRNAKLVFVGPVDKTAVSQIKELSSHENFFLAGKKPLNEIPYYLKLFSVGIIPFKITKFTEGVVPIKFFEYLNASVPIVTTALPDLKQFKNVIGYSESYKEFIENCKDALNGKFDSKVENYRKLSEENSWSKRVDLLEKFFESRFDFVKKQI